MLISNERILHMHGVAEWMYEHAEEYGCENKEEMYLLGLVHDIGYIHGKENHEQHGSELVGLDTYYGDFIEGHGMTPLDYANSRGISGQEIPNEMILLWTADMMIDMTGKPVGFATRLKNIGDKYGYNSEPYRICSETIAFLHMSISDKKPIKTIRKTIRNTVVRYNVPTITDQKSSLNWIISVIEHPSLKIKNIALDDLSHSGDEGNSSTTTNSKISEKDLLKICNKNDTDVISLTAKFEGIPIIIGVDLRSYKPFITIRNQNPINIELIEKELLKLNNR